MLNAVPNHKENHRKEIIKFFEVPFLLSEHCYLWLIHNK
uniref:Transposase n=1 Tax=Ascaris lumbricoides TaxID=6252 RepID=A0A0M3IPP0_ASCLU